MRASPQHHIPICWHHLSTVTVILHMSRSRFKRPYIHAIKAGDAIEETRLTIKQAKFEAEGFASTGNHAHPLGWAFSQAW